MFSFYKAFSTLFLTDSFHRSFQKVTISCYGVIFSHRCIVQKLVQTNSSFSMYCSAPKLACGKLISFQSFAAWCYNTKGISFTLWTGFQYLNELRTALHPCSTISLSGGSEFPLVALALYSKLSALCWKRTDISYERTAISSLVKHPKKFPGYMKGTLNPWRAVQENRWDSMPAS
jgi:hypothetical protein